MTDNNLAIIEKMAVLGNFSSLTNEQKVSHYMQLCESQHLNPLSKPFDLIEMTDKNGKRKMTVYANKDASDQLRRRDKISIKIISREFHDDVYIVTAQATTSDGRSDESIGVVALSGQNKEGKTYKLMGDIKANKLMHAETKAKRRVTLSIAGLGFLDESELHSIKDAKAFSIDLSTGEILEKAIEGVQQEFIPADKSQKNTPPKQEIKQEKPPEAVRGEVREGFDAFTSAEWLIAQMKENSESSSLNSLEFWVETTAQEKKDIWTLLSKEEKEWVKKITAPRISEEQVNNVSV